jgi:hypothetical protein
MVTSYVTVADCRAKYGRGLRHSRKIKGGKRKGIQWHVIAMKTQSKSG